MKLNPPTHKFPRQIGDISPVPASERHCAECNQPPPTRWWLLEDFLPQRRSEMLNKHSRNCPTFLCDSCTGITPEMVKVHGERTWREDAGSDAW